MAPRRRLGTQPEQPNQGFLDAMYAAFQGMATRARNERPAEDRKQGYFQEFRRAPIPSFNMYKMEGLANTWWKQVKRRMDVVGLTWEQFETLFNDQYLPQSYREEKALEFMSLQQGDMSVRQYEAKFNDLSWFAPSLVESEHMRCLKFEKGLKNSVRRSLLALRLRNFRDLVAAATRVEQDSLAYHQSKEEEAGRVSVSGRPSISGGPQRSGRRNRNKGQMVGEMASGGSSSSGSDRNAPYGPRGKGKVQGQAYTLAGGSSGGQTNNAVVEGATHSFVSSSFVQTLKLKSENLKVPMTLNSPLGCVEVMSVCKSCEITIGSERLRADLISLSMTLFDVVLRMDWLSRHGAIVDCYHRKVTLMTDSGT
ncbi:uncharacterized protein LOC112090532, partial [Morus notabilis]|uniref:uncharacterized protein LOC112090532 n=1 Tax=Morus notabilis TaxID=981085 RepID=UPI000CED3A63